MSEWQKWRNYEGLINQRKPEKEGCTYTALKEVADELERNGVETEIFHIGTAPVKGCMGCGYCAKTGNHQCVYNDDTVNEAILKAKDADGFVFGSPVHYAAASGAITSFLTDCFTPVIRWHISRVRQLSAADEVAQRQRLTS